MRGSRHGPNAAKADDLIGAEHRGRGSGHRWIALLAFPFLVVLLAVASVGAGARSERIGSPTAATAAEAADLARRAATDDAALAELRSLRSIDGRPVDLGAATGGLGPQRAVRLRTLAAALDGGQRATSPPVASRDARRRARAVLEQRRYQKQEPPKPFEGVIRWLGDRLDPVLGPISRFFSSLFESLARVVPGGGIVVAALVAGGVATVMALLIMRRSGARLADQTGGESLLVDLAVDPADLDREAAAAEAAGDLDLAIRRRYEAGVVRLGRAGRIAVQADTTASRVAAEVGGAAIEALTTTFEQVVYGRVPATVEDVDEARTRWVEVVGAGAHR